ncbi:nucleotide disphospho-sugar-binding domain-containing protein [Actinomadura yumaensis]|uniref:nucleotide disphospho-sugar-binding domain-containing protein n=1 Tax=Actinomadura yumaensis TaxID=111807 RepID=UPI003610F716
MAHGGAGSLLTALAAGLPQVLVPRLPDHVRHAARIAETGAGAVLPAPVEDPAAIRDRLAEVLAEPAYRDAAGRLRGEMLAQPSPAAVVPEIERVVARSASGPVQPVSIRR